MTFTGSGKHFLSVTNALIDDTHPFGSSGVAINVPTPITVSSISDGYLDNYYGIITIPRNYLITLIGWSSQIGVSR
jgi:hypothetical protein